MKTLFSFVAILLWLNVFSQDTIYITSTTYPDLTEHEYNLDDNLCDPVLLGTMPWAILKALDSEEEIVYILFNINGQEPHIINATYALPQITRRIVVDATTQPGYQTGTPAIILDGGENVNQGLSLHGISNSIVKGLCIRNFRYSGVFCNNVNNSEFYDNVIYGIYRLLSDNLLGEGCIGLVGSSNNILKGNILGTDPTGNTYSNKYAGINIQKVPSDRIATPPSSGNVIGGTQQGEGNTISNNPRGIMVGAGCNGNLISGNRIFNNTTAIFLSQGTLFPFELGGNYNKSAPVIDSFIGTVVSGTSAPNDIIEIFGSTGNENANEYLTTVTADANGDWTANVSTSYEGVVVTGTDIHYNSSSFSVFERANFEGEYQIWLGDDFYWCQPNLISLSDGIKYRFEVVSFPFIPDNMYDTNGNLAICCTDNSSTRRLILPPFNNVTYQSGHGYGWSNVVLRETIHREITGSVSWQNMSTQPTGILSALYRNASSTSIYYDALRDYLPHSIIKYTLYFYSQEEILDSLILINDLTRGKMKEYPFGDYINSYSNNIEDYDLIVKPTLLTSDYPYYDDQTNQQWYKNGSTPLGTVNYFTKPETYYFDVYPNPVYTGTMHVPFNDGQYNYTNPTPYSLLRSDILNVNADNYAGYYHNDTPMIGITHKYIIDKNFNLRNINPSEKIIYNPSECYITANHLVFPSDYTFKTLNTQGDFIELDNLLNNYPHVLYDEEHWKDMPVSTGLESVYYIESGATLEIEPCVTIMDARIIVNVGGTLIYDPEQTYGNYIIQDDGGNIVLNSDGFSYCDNDCKDFRRYNANNINIEVNTTWDLAYIQNNYNVPGNTFGVAGKVTIATGKTLTIRNIEVQFSNIGEIIVETGAKIIIDNAVIKSACNQPWVGINVKGNASSEQVPISNQGFVSLVNEAEIRDAYCGLNVYSGGVVNLNNSKFINNVYGISFKQYESPSHLTNRSIIRFCEFKTVNALKGFVYPISHIRFNGVKGITIYGCEFSNTRDSSPIGIEDEPLYANKRGCGILSTNSSFKVLPLCSYQNVPQYGTLCPTITKKNKFDGLYYAIKASTINSALTVTINQSEFTGNYRGVLLENMQYPTILSNSFDADYNYIGTNLYLNYPPSYGNSNYSLYLNGCTGYRVEENLFTQGHAGVFINNSGFQTNRVYFNTFRDVNQTGFASALNALGTNHDISDGSALSSGLEFECNTFRNNMYDMSVIGGATIKPIQGSNNIPTGNKSIHFCPYSESDFYVSNYSPLNYKYFFNVNEALTCYTYQSIETYPTLSFNNCESQTFLTPPISMQKSELALEQDEIDRLKTELYEVIDGGNTQYLLNLVGDLKPSNFIKTCNTLLQSTPYLSDTVLLSFMNKNITGHYDKKRDVLLACSPLPDKSKEQLYSYYMPPPMKNSIMQAQVGINAIDLKKSEIASKVSERQTQFNRLIAYALYYDSVPEMKDSIISFLYDENTLQVKNYLIPLLISNEMYTDAQTQIDDYFTIISNMPYETRLQYENQAQLFSIIKIFSENHEDTSVIASNISFLENLAGQANSIGSIHAVTLLEYYKAGLYDYPEIIEFPEMYSSRLMNAHSISQEESLPGNTINIFPNPANSELFINYNFSDKSDVVLELFSFDGKMVLCKKISGQSGRELIDISQLPVGLYHVRIGSFNKSIAIVR